MSYVLLFIFVYSPFIVFVFLIVVVLLVVKVVVEPESMVEVVVHGINFFSHSLTLSLTFSLSHRFIHFS